MKTHGQWLDNVPDKYLKPSFRCQHLEIGIVYPENGQVGGYVSAQICLKCKKILTAKQALIAIEKGAIIGVLEKSVETKD